MKYLFPNFLKDLAELRQSQLYWLRVCREVLEKNYMEEEWILGAEISEMDLSSFDNFGLVGGMSFDKTKGIQINQQDPEIHTKHEIVAWTADSQRFLKTAPIIYLVFNCNLSNESAEIFKILFEKWIQPECDREEMDKFIEATLG